jgi:DNA sulfur modification protein DndD
MAPPSHKEQMIINEIVLHNFGAYHGRQRILLRPVSAERPVILFGGQNGAGKTTLLDALQLALYGKLAQCSNRHQLSYEEYLRRGIHRSVSPMEGAAIELEFSHSAEGRQHTYRVHRSWKQQGNGIREYLEVRYDGRQDAVLTDSWDEQIEAILPRRIAPLFFFDGEKIEALADPSRSAELLSTAIHSLLGVDLVDQLQADLVVLERRKRTELKTEAEREVLRREGEELAHVDAELSNAYRVHAGLRTDLAMARNVLSLAENRFRTEGGELFEDRNRLEDERKKALKQLDEAEKELRGLAAEVAPLLLVEALLNSAAEQDAREEEAAEAVLLTHALRERDQQLLEQVRQADASGALVASLTTFLRQDRAARAQAAETPRYLHFGEETRAQVGMLCGGMIAFTSKRLQHVLDIADQLHCQRTDLERTLARIPDRERIANLLETRETARGAVRKAEERLLQCTEEVERISRLREHLKSRLAAQIERRVEQEFADEAAERIINHAVKIRGTLNHFRLVLVRRHVERIEQLILESFQQLLRKKALVTGLRIDPQTFAISIQGPAGAALTLERLSAGERQLLAVAMLWGLARASDRLLPVVIDTPLGRLDRAHRTHLVERYFPSASHQVLLLSTDEEIRGEYLDTLRPAISTTYNLVYDNVGNSTRVVDGYFMAEVA